jgi:hypothetical protein
VFWITVLMRIDRRFQERGRNGVVGFDTATPQVIADFGLAS